MDGTAALSSNLVRQNVDQSSNPSLIPSTRAIEADDDDDTFLVPGFFESHFFLWISTTLYASVAVYSGVMASLPSIFVPQLCCPKVIHAMLHSLDVRPITSFFQGIYQSVT
jgi:hypothetical protein